LQVPRPHRRLRRRRRLSERRRIDVHVEPIVVALGADEEVGVVEQIEEQRLEAERGPAGAEPLREASTSRPAGGRG
jgi:hypothetical protein